MMTLAGKISAFPAGPRKEQKDVAAGSAYPAMRGMALWVFSYVASASCAGCAVPPS